MIVFGHTGIQTGRSGKNSVSPDQTTLKEQSDQGLHMLPFSLHVLDVLLYGKFKLVKF